MEVKNHQVWSVITGVLLKRIRRCRMQKIGRGLGMEGRSSRINGIIKIIISMLSTCPDITTTTRPLQQTRIITMRLPPIWVDKTNNITTNIANHQTTTTKTKTKYKKNFKKNHNHGTAKALEKEAPPNPTPGNGWRTGQRRSSNLMFFVARMYFSRGWVWYGARKR